MAWFNDMTDEERRTRRQAVGASVLLHLFVVLVLVVGIPRFSREQTMTMSVPVEMLTEDDLLAEQVARTDAEPVEEAESESVSEAETEEAASETPAETVTAEQPETAGATQAPQPTESQPAEATSEAQPTPPVPAAAPDTQPAEPVEPVPQVAASPQEAQQPQEAPAATVEQTDSTVVEAPEAEVAEATPPAEETEAEELAAAEPQQVEAREPEQEAPPIPRRRPESAPSELQQAEAEPESEPEPEPAPQTPQQDEPTEPEEEADPLASILRNVEELQPQERQQAAAPTPADTDTTPRTSIALQRRAAELGDLIRDQVASCWRIDGGIQEARSLRVPIRVRLAQDGSVIGEPSVQEPTRYASDGYYRSAADAAVRAVLRCAPLRLPPQDYDIWRDLVLNFDPREMF